MGKLCWNFRRILEPESLFEKVHTKKGDNVFLTEIAKEELEEVRREMDNKKAMYADRVGQLEASLT